MNKLYASIKAEVKRLAEELRVSKQENKQYQRDHNQQADSYTYWRHRFSLLHEFRVKHLAMSLYRGHTVYEIGNYLPHVVAQAEPIVAALNAENEVWRAANAEQTVCASA